MKLLTMEGRTGPPEYDPRQLFSDLFHQLSQPVTSLCCSLELTLLQTHTVEQYGDIVSRTLGEAEKVSWLATALRELFDAGQAGEDCETLELRGAVEQTVGDLLPVAESAGVQVYYLPLSACPVWFDVARLRKGLFHLLGFVLASSGRGGVAKIELDERGEEAVLGLTVSTPEEHPEASPAGADREHPPQDLVRRLGLGIARAIFEAAGGNFKVERSPEGVSVEVRILQGRARSLRRPEPAPADARP